MDISYIILTWNSQKYINICVNSIIDDIKGSNFKIEIFIIDNGSQDKTFEQIQNLTENYPDIVKPILLSRNYGTTYSRNLALKRASGRYLCILDSDIEIINPGLSDALIKTLDLNPKFGLVAPRLLYPNGNLQKSTDQFPTIIRKFYRYFFLKKIEKYERENSQNLQKQPVDYAISALWMFNRATFQKVGLLDEKIFYAPEDVDYCLRIWKSNLMVIYEPSVSAVHHTQELSRNFRLNKATINHLLGLLYFFYNHRFFFIKPKFKETK